MALTVYTLAERPDLTTSLLRLSPKVWPYFVLEADASLQYFGTLFEEFLEYSFVICDHQEQVIAGGSAIPLAWDGTLDTLPKGWDGALAQGVADRRAGRIPSALSAVSATINPAHQGLGLGQLIIRSMQRIGRTHGLDHLICAVRPSQKSQYPLTPLEDYIGWKLPDGTPFDPWIRTHWRLGAEYLRIEPESMVTTGSVGAWEEWTQLRFPQSGSYVVPGALVPITIDREQDRGRYAEPNVWMRHDLTRQSAVTAERAQFPPARARQTLTIGLKPTRQQHEALLETANTFQGLCAALVEQARSTNAPSVLALTPAFAAVNGTPMPLPAPLALRAALLAETSYRSRAPDGQMRVPAEPVMPLDEAIASFHGLTHITILTCAGPLSIPFLIEQVEQVGAEAPGETAELRLLDKGWQVSVTLETAQELGLSHSRAQSSSS